MTKEFFELTNEKKKLKKISIVSILLLIINTLFVFMLIFYYGYYKPIILIPTSLSGLLINNLNLKICLILDSYLIMFFLLLQNASLILFLVFNSKEMNRYSKISNIIYYVTNGIIASLLFTYITIDFTNCGSTNLIINFLESAMIVSFYAISFAFIYEINNYYSLKKIMDEYL